MVSIVFPSLVLLLCLGSLRSVVVGVLKDGAPMKHFMWITLYGNKDSLICSLKSGHENKRVKMTIITWNSWGLFAIITMHANTELVKKF